MGICGDISKKKFPGINEESVTQNKIRNENYENINKYDDPTNNFINNNYEAYNKIINNNYSNIDEVNPINNDKTNKTEEDGNNYNSGLTIPHDKTRNISKQLRLYICKLIGYGKSGTGFFCKIPYPNKLKYLHVLMTNEHVINKDELLENKKFKVTFDDDKIERTIYITPERKIYSSAKNDIDKLQKYDVTIIEIFPEQDNIFHFLELDITNNNINEIIYILQYPGKLKSSISYGKIIDIVGYNMYNDCSTLKGSSGGPILLLKNYKVIGIHKIFNGYNNIGTSLIEPIKEFNSIFLNENKIIKNSYINCILCEYSIKNEEEFDLLHDYNLNRLDMNYELSQLYNKGKKKKKLLEENINIYINDKLIKFNFKYKTTEKIIYVKFIFKEILNDLSFMFYNCKCLKSVDMSPFDALNVTDMSYMFGGCESLESIDFFSFNTSNVTNMSGLFSECKSLKSIDLSSFNTSNVINMKEMFNLCSSIKTLDLTSFNTINVTNVNKMLADCHSLKYLLLSSFNTTNVINMSQMFSRCLSIKFIDLSSFNTSKVIDMSQMFEYCQSLEEIDLSSFNTINVKDMKLMFNSCFSLKSLDLSKFNTINVKYMTNMFCGNFSLQSLDLSSFSTNNVINLNGMFLGCNALKNVKCKDQTILNLVNTINKFKLIVK